MIFLLTPGMLEIACQYSRLKQSKHYNQVMYEHYQHLYSKSRASWQFTKTAMLWLKMRSYKKQLNNCLAAQQAQQ